MTPMKRLGALGSFRHKKKSTNENPTSFPKTELALKILTFVAVVAAGIWALYQYQLAGSNEWVIGIKLKTKVLPYRDNLRLLVVNVESTNPRKYDVVLDPELGDSFELRFRKFAIDAKEKTVVGEDEGDLIQKADLIPKGEQYEFLPGAKMDDMRTIVIPAHTTVMLTAEIQRHNGELNKSGKPDTDHVSASTIVRVE